MKIGLIKVLILEYNFVSGNPPPFESEPRTTKNKEDEISNKNNTTGTITISSSTTLPPPSIASTSEKSKFECTECMVLKASSCPRSLLRSGLFMFSLLQKYLTFDVIFFCHQIT